MQRDYILRLIEQVAQLLSRVIRQREAHTPHEALQSIMAAFERLFGLEAVQIFQFTPDQHRLMLAEDEQPAGAYEKIMMYAALNVEAGRCYAALGQPKLAEQSFLNALRTSLKAGQQFPGLVPPSFAPKVPELLLLLGDMPLDEEMSALLAAANLGNTATPTGDGP